MRHWESSLVSPGTGWRRDSIESERLLGREFDKDEARLLAAWKPRVRREDD